MKGMDRFKQKQEQKKVRLLVTVTHISLMDIPYANHVMALIVRKNDKDSGMNSTLFVLTT